MAEFGDIHLLKSISYCPLLVFRGNLSLLDILFSRRLKQMEGEECLSVRLFCFQGEWVGIFSMYCQGGFLGGGQGHVHFTASFSELCAGENRCRKRVTEGSGQTQMCQACMQSQPSP